MSDFSNRKNKQRQEWNPHWTLKILYGIWYTAIAALKVAADSKLKEIRESAFRECKITNIDLPKKLEVIESHAFLGNPLNEI